MDALTHAIEAYVSTLNGPFTDPLALQAIEMVLDYLPASYNCNMEAREQMHYAQCLAGMKCSFTLVLFYLWPIKQCSIFNRTCSTWMCECHLPAICH